MTQNLDREEDRMANGDVRTRHFARGSRGIFADVDAMRAALPKTRQITMP
jgi:hypothetical protein